MGGHNATGLTKKTSIERKAIAPATLSKERTALQGNISPRESNLSSAIFRQDMTFRERQKQRVVDIWATLANIHGSLQPRIERAISQGQEQKTNGRWTKRQTGSRIQPDLDGQFKNAGEDPRDWEEYQIPINIKGLKGHLVYFRKKGTEPIKVRHDIGMRIHIDDDDQQGRKDFNNPPIFVPNPRANAGTGNENVLWADRAEEIAATPDYLIIEPTAENIPTKAFESAIDSDSNIGIQQKATERALVNKNSGLTKEAAEKLLDTIDKDQTIETKEKKKRKEVIKKLAALLDKNGSLNTFVQKQWSLRPPNWPIGYNKLLRPITHNPAITSHDLCPLGVPKKTYIDLSNKLLSATSFKTPGDQKASLKKLSKQLALNSDVVKVLTADGSDYEDWDKYSIDLGPIGGVLYELHFHYNKKTGQVNHAVDLKVKAKNKDDVLHIDSITNNIGVTPSGIVVRRDRLPAAKKRLLQDIKAVKAKSVGGRKTLLGKRMDKLKKQVQEGLNDVEDV